MAPSISGDLVSCLGVSEPGAGSDVASILTTARREGDDLVINGQKLWITSAWQADWICLLANTSQGPAHRNKSLICLPMDTPGKCWELFLSFSSPFFIIWNDNEWELNQLLFADDTVVVADSERKLCQLVTEFGRVCEGRKLRVNVGKSKVMRCIRNEDGARLNAMLNGEALEEVDQFKQMCVIE